MYAKTASEVVSFGIEYGGDLAVGDTLAISEWTAPSGVVLGADFINAEPVPLRRRAIPAQHLAVVSVSGGALNRFYDVTNVVTTAAGETFERRFRIHIKSAFLL